MAAETLDLNARYAVTGYGGIAWYLIGYAQEWTEGEWSYVGGDEDDPDDETLYVWDEPEQYEVRERVRAVMVGDDRVFEIDTDDLTPLDEDDYCHVCGQIGCTHDGRERD